MRKRRKKVNSCWRDYPPIPSGDHHPEYYCGDGSGRRSSERLAIQKSIRETKEERRNFLAQKTFIAQTFHGTIHADQRRCLGSGGDQSRNSGGDRGRGRRSNNGGIGRDGHKDNAASSSEVLLAGEKRTGFSQFVVSDDVMPMHSRCTNKGNTAHLGSLTATPPARTTPFPPHTSARAETANNKSRRCHGMSENEWVGIGVKSKSQE